MSQERDITRDIALVFRPGRRPGNSCPEAELLAAYAESSLPANRRTELENHLADCSFCLGQMGFLVREGQRDLPAAPEDLLDAVREPRADRTERSFRPAWPGLAAAAALVVAAAVVLQLDHTRELSPPGSPETGPSASSAPGAQPNPMVRRVPVPDELVILDPREGAVLDGREIEIRWQQSQRALQYAAILVNLEGDLLWEGRTTGHRLTIPPAVLTPGERHFIWIEAKISGEGTLKSGAVGFLVTPD